MILKYTPTKKQEAVAIWLSSGLSTLEIAERMTLSETTIKSHATNIYKAVGVKNRHQYMAWVYGRDFEQTVEELPAYGVEQ